MIDRRGFLQASLALGLSCASSPRPRPPAPKLRLLILGGTGFLGPAVVEAARPRGHTLTLFNRGRTNTDLFPDLEQLHGDRDGKLDALRGHTWDAVIDDTGFKPRVVRMSAELLEPAVKRYLFISTLSVYSDERTLKQDETAALAKMPAGDENSEDVPKYYSPLKAACEGVVSSIYGARATLVRPGYIVGPRDPLDRLTYWVARCERGGQVLAPGDGNDPTQFIDVRDLGAFIVDCVERDLSGAYNATGPAQRLTMKGFLEACQAAAGAPSSLVWVPEAVIKKNGIDPESDEKEYLPLWLPHHALGEVSIAKSVGQGLRFRPTVDTARDTLAWWKAQPEARRAKMRGGLDADKEKAILEAR